ncbi:hypothetical protein [Methylorubrum sp. POS3]|uniref:hypothetical protein n=1 Tax=Methylorubrum sp. POS3 TaxID=2998492 RepID=UPI00372D2100
MPNTKKSKYSEARPITTPSNRDLLYVSSAPFSEVAKVLSVVSTIASPVGSAASIYTVTR